MKCINCGFENPEMSKFCGKCGKTFVGEKTPEKQKEKGTPSYKKFLIPGVIVLAVLFIVFGIMTPKTTDVSKTSEQTPTSSDSTNAKTSESSATPTKATLGSKTIILEPIVKESAGLSGTFCCTRWSVGDSFQTFLSYSMADLPANVTITDVTLDFSNYDRDGDPFSYLGCMGVYVQEFGVPDAKDFFLGMPTDAIAKWCSDPELSSPLKSKNLASVLQNKLGNSRFQIRLQFDKNTDNNYQADDIVVRSPKIIVAHTVP